MGSYSSTGDSFSLKPVRKLAAHQPDLHLRDLLAGNNLDQEFPRDIVTKEKRSQVYLNISIR